MYLLPTWCYFPWNLKSQSPGVHDQGEASRCRRRRLWRWREGWWELGYRKKNSKDGYHDTGWYLWGPDGSFGEWIASHKADAMSDADRLITKHLAATAKVKQ
ncbi:hypothetical protein [Streptomyces sp. NPDC018833]|uniref:hypothetical protein n=1 Tax=Streptomyces sp. NPDC018833 TaxID=3365053 RepID=UPI0037B76F12